MKRGFSAPSCVLKPARPSLEPSNAHVSRAPAGSSNAREGAVGQVKDATTVVRAVVCDLDHHAFPIVLIGHAHLGAKGKGAMGGSEAVGIKACATGRTLAVKAITNAIPRGSSALNRSLGFLGAERNEQRSSKAEAKKRMEHQERGESS